MATITLQYDGRNTALKQLIQLFLTLGGKVIDEKGTSFAKSVDDLNAGRVHEAKNGNDLIKQCLG